MEVKPECIPCLIDVRCREVIRVLDDSPEAFKICLEVVQTLLKLLDETRHTTKLATELYRLVLKRLGVDPYKGDKEAANEWALNVLPSAISMLEEVDDPLERFRAAVRFSLVGNAIDLGVSGYRFSLEDLERAFETVRLEVDDTVEAYDRVREASRVLYLCDNTGEVVLDRLLVRELRRLGASVTVVVRSEPYQNDATMEDAYESGIASEADRVIAAGEGTYLSPDLLSKPFLEELENSDLVVLKGMANYENLSLLQRVRPSGYLLLLKAKCRPIAESLGVEVGDYVAKLV